MTADVTSVEEETSFHPVSGGGVIFNAAEGRLYAVNPVAGLTWLCVKDGLSTPECIVAISKSFHVHQSVAAEWLCSSIEMFNNFGLLSTEGREIPRTHPAAQVPKGAPLIGAGSGVRYQIFEKHFCVAAPSKLQPVIDSLLRNLRIDITKQTRPPSLQIDISPCGDTWEVAVSGQEISCTTESVAPELERLLVQAVVPATPHLLTFHAAAVQHGARTFLLAGQSGTGKTTLSLALTQAGWDFGSDEIVLLSRDLCLRPLPFPPCIKADTFSSVETWFPELRSLPEHDRYGKRIKYLPIKSKVFDADAGFVVFPHYDRSGDNESRPLDSFLGLQRLLSQCVFVPAGFRHDDVRLLLQWHSRQQYCDVRYNNCEAAVDFLKNMEVKEVNSH